MNLSAPERMILEALVISPDLLKIQVRADVLLRAAAGAEDEQIAAELLMKRKDVLHWRKRFEAHGIRGLWDSPGPGSKKRMSPEKEAAVLSDVLYPLLNWNAQQLALLHGLSRSAVNRICTKHGIKRGQWDRFDIEHMNIFVDPLFGITVSGVAGVYFGNSGVLALTTSGCAFSELHMLSASPSVLQTIDLLLGELGKFAKLCPVWFMAFDRTAEQNVFLEWLDKIECRRALNSEIHLLTDSPGSAPEGMPAVREWLTGHPHFQVHHAPTVQNPPWFNLVRRCFRIIGKLPVQANLVQDVKGLAKYLASMPDQSPRIINVCHSLSEVDSLNGSIG